jgi:hypothetical protein
MTIEASHPAFQPADTMSATVSTHTTAPAITVEALLTTLRAASPEEMAALLAELNRGMPLWDAAKKPAPTARAQMAIRAAEAASKLPEAVDGMPPSAAAYRMAADEIDLTVCVGRRLADAAKDTRWKPAVYREFQCGKAQEAEGDLCATCRARKDRYDANPKAGDWVGRITEEPLGWLHMLGTDWATGPKGPKWRPAEEDAGSDAASVASGGSGATEKMSTAPAPAPAPAPVAAAPVATAPVSTSSKAEIAAAKAKAKAEEALAKEAAKAAEKAAKEAAKAAEKAAKAAAKPAPKAKAAAAATVSAPAKAAPAADATEVAGDIKMIGITLYLIKGRNVYSYDNETEKAGAFVGILNEEGDDIDADADEE